MTYIPDDAPGPGVPDDEPPATRRAMGCAFEVVETLVLTLLIYLVIHNFLAQPFEVQQSSMLPTIAPNEYILIDKLTPRFDRYHLGDVVVFTPPAGSGISVDNVPFIKRIVGLPGDTVRLRNGRVFITPAGGTEIELDEPYVARLADDTPEPTLPRGDGATEWVVPDGSYFVLGDHREVSQDSRTFGPIEADLILGRAWVRYFPIDRIGIIERPDYPELAAESGAAAPTAGRGGSSATIQRSTSRP
jgi:signal peptidase I